jgi:two-component system, chemotaxis family, chemotaxis protein CheY
MPYDVLIVDDSDVTRSMIIKTLSLAKIPISNYFEAANGREALEILDERWIDLVLADLNMPIMGGDELLRIMRASRQLADIPVIVVTSEQCGPERLGGVWKAAAYVRKPFAPEEIRDAFTSLVQQRETPPPSGSVIEQFRTALETVAFMFCEPLPNDPPPAPSGEFFRARMAFAGAVSGVMTLTVPRLLAVDMAANALGVEPDDALAIRHDADIVGELLNITCGHVSGAVAGNDAVELEPPVVGRHEAERWSELTSDPSVAWCLVEGHPVALGLGTRAAV